MSDVLVSVVIPTYKRPHLVPRAVRSALSQTLQEIEVTVVLDGPDPATLEALLSIQDERVRVEVLPANVGPAGARNAGVQASRGPWTAFLDDDDEWLPRKLELQLQTAQGSKYRYPIVSCRTLARIGSQRLIWPRRVPRPGEHVSEYLFCRHSPFFGEGLLQASTLFVSHSLALTVPFATDLRRFEDIDWVLRASAVPGAGIEFVPTAEPLATWNLGPRPTLPSHRLGWHGFLTWARSRRYLMTPRAYAGLILTWTGNPGNPAASRQTCWPALREAFARGRPRLLDVVIRLGYCFIPSSAQTLLTDVASRLRGQSSSRPEQGVA